MREQGNQRGNMVVLWVGYGLFLSAYCCGPCSSLLLSERLGAWGFVLASQLAYLLGTAAGCLLVRWAAHRRSAVVPPVGEAAVYALVTLPCLIAVASGFGGPTGVWVVGALFAVVGLVSALPLMFWYECLLDVCRAQGRARCILYIATPQLIPTAVTALASFVPTACTGVGFGSMVACVLAAAVLQALYARRGLLDPAAVRKPQRGVYRLAPFSTALLVCLGLTWILACSVSLPTMEAGLQELPWWVLPLTNVAACLVIVAVAWSRGDDGVRFGGFIRVAVMGAGMVLAFVPVLQGVAPALFYPLCEVVIVLTEVAVVLFSIEVCYERGLALADVMPVNYALFVGSACVGGLVFWGIQAFVGGQTAWELVAGLSTVAVVALIPFLPSRASNAVTFTLEELPENEGYEERAAKKRENLAAKYRLNEREQEVLEPLMRGLTRQQIAEELGLSPWTIKDRVASIYEKVGVHSYKELVQALE